MILEDQTGQRVYNTEHNGNGAVGFARAVDVEAYCDEARSG